MFVHPEITRQLVGERRLAVEALARDASRRPAASHERRLPARLARLASARALPSLRPVPTRVPTGC